MLYRFFLSLAKCLHNFFSFQWGVAQFYWLPRPNEHNSRQQARFEGAFIKCIFTNGTWNVHQRSLQCLSLGHMFSFSGTIVQLYNSAKKISIFCSSFNQSQLSFAILTAELSFYRLMRKKYDSSKLKSSKKYFIFLPAFYLIMWIMIPPKNF